ncbi:predicted protein [Arabidopsis lyrata subsp. lyrata]|uniref:Predicted protein n=1 Tax=Arabidopsis lyrata subsp. lyrata TaxID=81972 RepID=D7LE82_ARALL|nr:predicted protein [Arabidopsis lyrata subsp. lyrata]
MVKSTTRSTSSEWSTAPMVPSMFCYKGLCSLSSEIPTILPLGLIDVTVIQGSSTSVARGYLM